MPPISCRYCRVWHQRPRNSLTTPRCRDSMELARASRRRSGTGTMAVSISPARRSAVATSATKRRADQLAQARHVPRPRSQRGLPDRAGQSMPRRADARSDSAEPIACRGHRFAQPARREPGHPPISGAAQHATHATPGAEPRGRAKGRGVRVLSAPQPRSQCSEFRATQAGHGIPCW